MLDRSTAPGVPKIVFPKILVLFENVSIPVNGFEGARDVSSNEIPKGDRYSLRAEVKIVYKAVGEVSWEPLAYITNNANESAVR